MNEGDQWWQRNRKALEKYEQAADDPMFRAVEKWTASHTLGKLLDIGCSTGWRTSLIARKLGAEAVGVEPSEKAIADGRARYPNVTFHRALASALPFPDAQFDTVIVNFVLCWVSRETLKKTIDEMDRVLKPGGCLIIGDFCPRVPTQRNYHHLPEGTVTTYKENYSEPFLATGNYTRIEVIEFNHDAVKAPPPFDDSVRAAIQTLRKN